MAGRKDKNTVDYFPHFVESGKSLFIIESKFDNGYKLWFKTLELLGKSENHFIDLRDDMDLLFLISKLKTTEQELTSFYDLLAKLNSIDTELWENKIIFSENFSENIKDAYKRRLNKCMNKLQICEYLSIKCKNNSNSLPQQSTKESKVEESKVNTKTWRNDFTFYIEECKAGYKKFMENEELIKTQERLNSGINVKLSIEKGFINFWGKEAGWKHKKKSKTKTIDWETTIINSISMNKVYLTKNEI